MPHARQKFQILFFTCARYLLNYSEQRSRRSRKRLKDCGETINFMHLCDLNVGDMLLTARVLKPQVGRSDFPCFCVPKISAVCLRMSAACRFQHVIQHSFLSFISVFAFVGWIVPVSIGGRVERFDRSF